MKSLTRPIKVDPEFYKMLKVEAAELGIPMVKLTRMKAREHKKGGFNFKI
jgi:hypothetical protein